MAKKNTDGLVRVAGFDGGNHEAVLTFDVKKLITAPNYLSDGRLDSLTALRTGGGERDKMGEGEYVVEYDGRSYFFGKLAIEQGRDPRNNVRDNGRYWRHNLIALMALAGAAYSEDVITLRIITGLPIAVYKNRETRDEVRRRMTEKREHSFVLNGRARKLVIDDVKIVMEGQAAALTVGATNTKATQAIIDLGGRTTGFIYLEDGQIVPDKCGMLESGVERVGELIAAAVSAHHKRTMKPRDIRKALRTSLGDKSRGTITAGGTAIDITQIVDQSITAVALEIEDRARQLWSDNDGYRIGYDCEQVALVGGGAYYFREHLDKAIDTAVKVKPEPELANARAYKTLADKVWPDAVRVDDVAPVVVTVEA